MEIFVRLSSFGRRSRLSSRVRAAVATMPELMAEYETSMMKM